MRFASREDAGRQLGQHLAEHNVRGDLVAGLPRGGVVVAAAVAQALRLPLTALVVRKLGHPWNREFAVGALAEGGTVVLEDEQADVVPGQLAAIVGEETKRLQEYQHKFHPEGPLDFKRKQIMLLDDGLATGATMEAAVRACRKLEAAQVEVAVPVASASGMTRLTGLADRVFALFIDPGFVAVGHYYRSFSQTTDDEVLRWLSAAQPPAQKQWQATA